MNNSFKIKKGLVVNGSGSIIVNVEGSEGQLFSITDNGVISASAHFVPTENETFDLGSPTQKWRDLYLSGSSLYLGNIILKDEGGQFVVKDEVGEPISFQGTATTASYVEFNNVANKPTLVSSSAQVVDILNSINSYTSSNDTLNTTQNSRLDSLSTVSGSTIGRLDNIESLTSSYARTNVSNNFSGLQTFNNIAVNGTASFAYIESVTGSAKIIGDSTLILNVNTPAERFGGISVVDSGSTFSTSSILYDGLENQWIFQHTGTPNSGSSILIFGPLSTEGLGTEQGLTENRIPKVVTDHGHHLNDSNITDSGTLITLGSNTVVTGTIVASGTTLISGSSQISYTGLSNIPSDIVSGSSQIDAASTTNWTTNVKTRLNSETVISGSSQVQFLSISGRPAGLVSGSSQVNADTITNFDPNVLTYINSLGVVSGSVSSDFNSLTNNPFTSSTAITASNSIVPSTGSTLNLGSDTRRWNIVYTSDLSLKNDRGDWTIVEGEDDLFLYNNKRGKVYKFNLTEVNPTEAPPKKE